MAITVSQELKTAATRPAGSVPVSRVELYPVAGTTAAGKGLTRIIADGSPFANRLLWQDYAPLVAYNWGKDCPPLGINPNMLTDGATWSMGFGGYFHCVPPAGYTGAIEYTLGYVAMGSVFIVLTGWEGLPGGYGPSPHAIKECAKQTVGGDVWVPVTFWYWRTATQRYPRHKDERFVMFWKDSLDKTWRVMGADRTCPVSSDFDNVVGTPIVAMAPLIQLKSRLGTRSSQAQLSAIGGRISNRYILTIHKDGDKYHFHKHDDDTEFPLQPGQTINHNMNPGVAGGDFLNITWNTEIEHGDKVEVYTPRGEETPWTLPHIDKISIDATEDAATVLKFTVPVTSHVKCKHCYETWVPEHFIADVCPRCSATQWYDPDVVDHDSIYTYHGHSDSFGVLRKNRLIKAYLGYKVGGERYLVRRFTGYIQDVRPSHRRRGDSTEMVLNVTCFDSRVKAVGAPVTKIEDLPLGGLPNALSYDIIGCFPETTPEDGPDGNVRPPAFDKWNLADVVRTVLYQSGFTSSQLFAKDDNGEWLIDDRNVRLECTVAYPFSIYSELGARSEMTGEWIGKPYRQEDYGHPIPTKAGRWHEFAETTELPYLYQFPLDSDPWESLRDLCDSYGVKLSTDVDGNVVVKYPNNPRIYNTHELDVDGGTGASYTSETLTDMTKNWAADHWRHGIVMITLGKGAGQQRHVYSNNNIALAHQAWDVIPDAASLYIVARDEKDLDNNITYDSSWIRTPEGHHSTGGSGTDE